MSATPMTVEASRGRGATSGSGADRAPSLARLTRVELRKMVNTRAGFWVTVVVALIMLAVGLITAANHGGRAGTLVHVFHNVAQPGALLLPVIGVLLVAGEWSQRTTLTTFTLVPHRSRVIVAKLLASVAVSLGALVFALIVTVLSTAAFGDAPGGAGSLPGTVIAQGWLFFGAAMIMGVAFGAAFLSSTPAIVAYLLLPTIWDAVIGSFKSLDGLARWLDSSNTLDPLTRYAMSGTEWAHALATLVVWVGIPLVFGLWRVHHSDIG